MHPTYKIHHTALTLIVNKQAYYNKYRSYFKKIKAKKKKSTKLFKITNNKIAIFLLLKIITFLNFNSLLDNINGQLFFT